MTLLSLCNELFTYLAAFRQAAVSGSAPDQQTLFTEINQLFHSISEQAQQTPQTVRNWDMVYEALLVFADEQILESGWADAAQWPSLEEYRLGQAQGGARFFRKLAQADRSRQEVMSVFYTCLALGFHGHYALNDPRLQALSTQLLPRRKPLPQPAPLWAQPKPKVWKRLLIGASALIIIIMITAALWYPHLAAQAPGLQNNKPALAESVPASPAADAAPAAPSGQPPQSAPPEPKPDRAAAPKKQTEMPPPPPGYAVQAGLYAGPLQSSRMAENLTNAGHSAWVMERPRSEGRFYYVVLVGPFQQIEKADAVRQKIAQEFNIEPFIVDLSKETAGGP